MNKLYPQVKKLFNTAYQIVLDEYKETVPKHLNWQMGNFLSNHLNYLIYEGVKNGILSAPDDNNKEWLSLFAWKY